MTRLFRRKGSPYWWVTFQLHGNRHRYSTGCRDRRAADIEARRIRREVERHGAAKRAGLTRRHRLTVNQAGRLWLAALDVDDGYAESYREQLRRIYECHIRPDLGRVDVHELTPARLRGWRDSLQNGKRRASTVNRLFAAMRTFARWLVERGHLSENPCRGVKTLRERPAARHRALGEDVLGVWCAELEAGAPGYKRHDPVRARSHTLWVRFLCETGLRQSEGYALRWGWIDRTRRCLNLPATACKGARARLVPLTQRALNVLAEQRAAGPGRLVWGRTSRRKAMEGAWIRAELPGRCPTDHDFRHTAASMWIAAGATLVEVQRILGHRSLVTTGRYLHLYGDRSAALAERIDRARSTISDTRNDRPT